MSQEIAILNIGNRAISAQAAQYLANEMAAERHMLAPLSAQNVSDLFAKEDDINTAKLAANFRLFVKKHGSQLLEGLHHSEIITAQFVAFWAERDKSIGVRQFDRDFNIKIAPYVIRKMWEYKHNHNQIFDPQAAMSANVWFQLRAIREKCAEAINRALKVHLGTKADGSKEHVCDLCPERFNDLKESILDHVSELFRAAISRADITKLWQKNEVA